MQSVLWRIIDNSNLGAEFEPQWAHLASRRPNSHGSSYLSNTSSRINRERSKY